MLRRLLAWSKMVKNVLTWLKNGPLPPKKLVTVHNKDIGASLLPGIKAYFSVTFNPNILGFFDLCIHCGSIVRFLFKFWGGIGPWGPWSWRPGLCRRPLYIRRKSRDIIFDALFCVTPNITVQEIIYANRST